LKRPAISPKLRGLSIEQRSSMATRIRLSRVGRKKQGSFRIVVAGSMHARGGRVTETIGKYNPRTYPSYIEIDAARALHWLREGAEMSESVSALFRQAGILKQYAEGADAEGVVVIGDPQGKTRLADRSGGAPAQAVAAKEEPKAAAAEPKAAPSGAEAEAGEAGAEEKQDVES
jgi:small subunit ribosomal protein S16